MSEFTLSERQRKMARHALGLPNDTRKSYRNRYFVGEPCEAFDDWTEMVNAGMAERVSVSVKGTPIGRTMFYLTRPGAEAVLKRGERLCTEDFPPEVA